MSIRFVDSLKTSFGGLGGMLAFRYNIVEDGADFVVVTDQNGFFLQHDDFEELAVLWYRLYHHITPEWITAQNEKTLTKYFEPSVKSPITNRSRDPSGFIYVLEGDKYHKIGKSVNVIKRISEISPKLPFTIQLVHTFPSNDSNWAEKILHEKFADKRTNGEWFKLEPLDIAWLLNIKEMNRDDK